MSLLVEHCSVFSFQSIGHVSRSLHTYYSLRVKGNASTFLQKYLPLKLDAAGKLSFHVRDDLSSLYRSRNNVESKVGHIDFVHGSFTILCPRRTQELRQHTLTPRAMKRLLKEFFAV